MNRFCRLCLFLLFASRLLAVSVPDDLKKAVVFIYKQDGASISQYAPDGTGFLVGIPMSAQPNRGWVYLVTAKHVLHTDANNPNSSLFPRLYVRLNLKSGNSELRPMDISTSGPLQTVFLHSDESVDIAVIPLRIENLESYDIVVFPEDILTTNAELHQNQVGVGTDVFFAGMFTPYLGQKKSYPIVRFGRVAMLPEETVNFGGVEIQAYLIETFAFGGNSGSPVFFYQGAERTPGSIVLGAPLMKIVGLMKGCFNDVEPIKAVQAAAVGNQVVPVSVGNAGIAVVVPAYLIREVLHYPDLENRRK